MKIIHETIQNIEVFRLFGNCLLKDVENIRKDIMPFVDEPNTPVVILNMEEINFIDSSGMAVLVSMYKKMIDDQRELIICHLSKHAMDAMTTTGLKNLFSIYDTEEAALQATL